MSGNNYMIPKRNILALELRKKIYNFILKNLGLYERDFKTNGHPKSTLKHHLNYLINRDLAILKNFGNYNKYFIGRKLSKREKEILDLLRKQNPLRIILCLYAGAACKYAHNIRGCFLLAASGNDNLRRLCYHARFNSVISVGAVNKKLERCDPGD